MILFHKNYSIQPDKLNFKKKRNYSNEFNFIPIKYDKKELLIQTPLLFIPFGINKYSTNSTKQYLDLSFQNNDKDFINFLTTIFNTVSEKYSNEYQVENFIKESQYSRWMRYKINDHCHFYNQSKQRINSFDPKTFGNFIIHLTGLWIMNQKIWFNWTILQGKIYIPIKLKEYAFIDEISSPPQHQPPPPPPLPPPPPPPPPPPDKYSKMLKIGIPKHAVEQKKTIDRIQAKDLQNVVLKKTEVNTKKEHKKNDNFIPSIDELRSAIQSLQKID